MPEFDISPWDIAVLVIYVAGTRVFFGWLAAKRGSGKDSEGYFLAGRSMRWPLIGLSFYVANMSGSSFVGLPGSAYNDGIAVFHYEWIPAFILVFYVAFILPFYLQSKIYTAPEYLEVRYGRESRLAFSGFLLLANILVDAAAAFYACATIGQTLFPEIPFWATVVAVALIAGVYIYFGGLGAVVLNDAVQATLIIAGGVAISILAWQAIPSWDAVKEAAPENALRLWRPADDALMPWPGAITGVLVIGLYFWCSNQFIIQRSLAAKDLEQGRKGALFAGLLKIPNLFILILPGVMAAQLYPDLDNPDLAFSALAFDLLPVGLRGLILAAVAAAILSSLEAILNSASTLFTMDFVKTLKPGVSEDALVRAGKLSTLVFMALAALWAPQITRFPTLWQYLQSILSYVTPPAVAVFLMGIFWRRANRRGAFVTLVTGVFVGIACWTAVEALSLVKIQYLYACGLMLVFSVALHAIVSLATAPPPAEKIEHTTWTRAVWRRDTEALRDVSWRSNYRYLSVGLMAFTAAIVVWWW